MVTGRDLILYILKNHLEDESIFKDGCFIGCMKDTDAAAKFDIGVATLRVLHDMGKLPGVKIGDTVYIFVDSNNRIATI